MYGQQVGALNVYTKTSPSLGQPVFTKQKTQGQAWVQALVDLNPSVNFQVGHSVFSPFKQSYILHVSE